MLILNNTMIADQWQFFLSYFYCWNIIPITVLSKHPETGTLDCPLPQTAYSVHTFGEHEAHSRKLKPYVQNNIH